MSKSCEKCIHEPVCALYTYSGYNSDECCFYETRSHGEWIPVTEQLPENEDWVNVTILDESGDTPSRYTDFGWYLEAVGGWIVDNERRNDIIAWIPLAEPYKGESDEEVITTKEAIECIQAIRVQMFNNGKESKWTESCDMAIRELKQKLSWEQDNAFREKKWGKGGGEK